MFNMPASERKIAVIGLGYVGLPVAVAFGKVEKIIGFDINNDRIEKLREGHDVTSEIDSKELLTSNIQFTSNPKDLDAADFYIVAVPTPVDQAHQPNLQPLLAASETIGCSLNVGDIVVYESTVYPGATEEDCAPILEKCSGLIAGVDFFLGYSPERINPGDKENTFTTIKKIVAGQNEDVLNVVADVYSSVVTAGVYRVNSIKAAEAAKVIENSQRDLNIAFVNELSKIFHLMDIDTQEVLDAAASKWNFQKYNPGLVGGHCIGVDPYYLTYKAEKLGYHPEVLLAGRRINDGMAKYVAEQTIKTMIKDPSRTRPINDSIIAILGVTFKEDCPDTRNSKIFDLIAEIKKYGGNVVVHDPLADTNEVLKSHNVALLSWDELCGLDIDTCILAVGHDFYRKGNLPKSNSLIDVKSLLDKEKSNFRL